MIDEVIVGIIEDILTHKHKVNKDRVKALIAQYNIDSTILPEEWAEMLYFYETL